jgi:hypothetical protein
VVEAVVAVEEKKRMQMVVWFEQWFQRSGLRIFGVCLQKLQS